MLISIFCSLKICCAMSEVQNQPVRKQILSARRNTLSRAMKNKGFLMAWFIFQVFFVLFSSPEPKAQDDLL